MKDCTKRMWLGITVLKIYFVAAGEKVSVSDRYNIYVVCYHCHTYQRRLLFWQKMLSDNVILLSLSRLSMDQFVAVGSQCGITTFTIPSHLIRSKIWYSFSSSECGLG